MPVCLHCGELAEEGALFCAKCGYTLPQTAADARPLATAPLGPAPVVPPPFSPGATLRPMAAVVPPGAYAAPAVSIPGAVAAIPPPPNAKYCTRCATLISSAAVYCPVCQQPQG